MVLVLFDYMWFCSARPQRRFLVSYCLVVVSYVNFVLPCILQARIQGKGFGTTASPP